ncbi:hypothetical protein [Geminisphaera colitermitum]|uniref:hypothetical protein n=1 Tax=Geminisphaera colitermitum TaxID=1148786 RepID=UPI000158D0F0|nr:hypothetical protein [Geminisphaera colitermitum]
MENTHKLALGSAAWLRAQADEKDEMLNAVGAFDDESEREIKCEILGLRDAASRMDLLDATITACHSAMLGKVNPKNPAWKMIYAVQDSHRCNAPASDDPHADAVFALHRQRQGLEERNTEVRGTE